MPQCHVTCKFFSLMMYIASAVHSADWIDTCRAFIHCSGICSEVTRFEEVSSEDEYCKALKSVLSSEMVMVPDPYSPDDTSIPL